MLGKTLFFACCVLLLMVSCSAAITAKEMTITWDMAAYSTISEFKLTLQNVISACDASSKPSFWKLNGGTSPTNLIFRVGDITSSFLTSTCGLSIKAKFPSIDNEVLYTGPSNCYVTDKGFVQGYPACTSILGESCTAATSCAAGTQCISGTCTISPIFHVFKYAFDALPTSADEAAEMLAAVKTHFTAASTTTDCAASGTTNNISLFQFAGSSTDQEIMLYISKTGSIAPNCKTAITTLTTPTPEFSLLATPQVSAITAEADATILDSTCYARTSAGFIQKLKFGQYCSIPLAIGATCVNSEDCPGTQSICETSASKGNVCSHKDLAAYQNANTFGKLTIVYPLQQTTIPSALAASIFQSSAAAVCSISPSFSVVSVPGSVTSFDILFFIETPPPADAQLTPECITALETVPAGTTPAPTSVAYSSITIDSLSCISTTGASTVTGFTPGGRCSYKQPVGGSCSTANDCDSTTIPATECQSSKCVKPGTDENAGETVEIRRVDLEATAYLGSEKGQKRVEAYLTRLNTIDGCKFTAASHAIGNAAYTRAYLYITPFDITKCTLEKLASAVILANQAVVTASVSGDVGSHEDAELLSATATFHALAEGEEPVDPTPPVEIIPTIKTAATKIYKYNAPKECISGTELECTSDCLIPCPFAHTCASNSQCGPNGKCDTQYTKCTQSGTAQEGYVPSNGASSAQLATFVVVLSLLFMVF